MSDRLDELKDRMGEIAQPFLTEGKMELVEVKVKVYREGTGIELLVDHPSGGITIDQCAWLNKRIVETIDQAQLFPQGYTLEVCSPGLDRPLKTGRDFARVAGKYVRVHVAPEVAGRLEYEGSIQNVQPDRVVLKTKKFGNVQIPLVQITKAVLVLEER